MNANCRFTKFDFFVTQHVNPYHSHQLIIFYDRIPIKLKKIVDSLVTARSLGICHYFVFVKDGDEASVRTSNWKVISFYGRNDDVDILFLLLLSLRIFCFHFQIKTRKPDLVERSSEPCEKNCKISFVFIKIIFNYLKYKQTKFP